MKKGFTKAPSLDDLVKLVLNESQSFQTSPLYPHRAKHHCLILYRFLCISFCSFLSFLDSLCDFFNSLQLNHFNFSCQHPHTEQAWSALNRNRSPDRMSAVCSSSSVLCVMCLQLYSNTQLQSWTKLEVGLKATASFSFGENPNTGATYDNWRGHPVQVILWVLFHC